MKKIIILSLAGLLLIGIAVGVTLFLVGGDSAEVASEDELAEEVVVEEVTDEEKPEPIYHSLDPAFSIAFQNPTTVRFLQVSMEVMTRNDDVVEDIKYHMPVIRDYVVMHFSSQNSEDLETREGKEELRSELLSGIQGILKAQTGDPGVEALYFTSFVMQ